MGEKMVNRLKPTTWQLRVAGLLLAVVTVTNLVYLGLMINYWLISGLLEPSNGNVIGGISIALMCLLTLALTAIVAGRVYGQIRRDYRLTTTVIAGLVLVIAAMGVLISITLVIYFLFVGLLLLLNGRFAPSCSIRVSPQ